MSIGLLYYFKLCILDSTLTLETINLDTREALAKASVRASNISENHEVTALMGPESICDHVW